MQGTAAWAQADAPDSSGTGLYPPVTVTAPVLPYRQFDRVEITGSSIIRKEQTQVLPVQIVTRAEIQRSGKHTTAELVQSLPAVFNSFSQGMLGSTLSGFNGGAIHGLQTGTLVLINGRRLSGNGRQTSSGVDNGGTELNWLPSSAIDRIELLTDGASSIYGTDAQTGVINIITRSESPGFEVTVDHRMPDRQKGQASRIDLSFGTGRLAQDGYSWFMAADVQNQQELLGRDQPYASAGRYLIQQGGQNYWAYGPGVSAAQTSPTLSASKSSPWQQLWNADYQNGQCPDNKVPAWGQSACLYNSYRDKGLLPASQSARVYAQGQLQIASDMTAYAELSWQSTEQRRTLYSWGQYAAKIGNSPGYPGYDLARAQGFDPATGTWLLYSGSELGPSYFWAETQTQRLVMGLKGQWNDWNFNTGYNHVRSFNAFDSNRITSYPNLGLDSAGVLTNPALLSPLGADTTLVQQLNGMLNRRPPLSAGHHQIDALDVKVSRSLGEIDGRDVYLALGVDWRQERADYENLAPSVTGIPSYEGRRTVWAQFAELQMPLPYNIETIASLRNDRYSDFGNTTHGKLSAKWTPADKWLVRGGWGTSFRAPAIAQMQETGKIKASSFSINCNADLQAMAAQLGGSCPADNQMTNYSQGSSRLKPELSTQWNLGLRFTPDRNNTVSLDYWQIDMRDKINALSPDIILSDPKKYAQNYELSPNGDLRIFSPMINMGRTQTSGIDFSWAFRRPTDWGQLHMGVSGTRLLTSRYQLADGETFANDLNTYSNYTSFVIPKLKTRWYVGLQEANWQGWVTVNHVGRHDGGPVDVIQADTGKAVTLPSHDVPAWWTIDLMLAHQWTSRTRMHFGIENLFNRKAPQDFSYAASFNYGTNPMLANVWGRTINLSLTHRF